MKHAILMFSLLIASQPLLIGIGVLVRWATECGSGACAGTMRANSPFGSPRDIVLTAFAAAAPYLLAGLAAAVTWLLAGQAAAAPAVPVLTPPEPRLSLAGQADS